MTLNRIKFTVQIITLNQIFLSMTVHITKVIPKSLLSNIKSDFPSLVTILNFPFSKAKNKDIKRSDSLKLNWERIERPFC